MVLSQNLNLQDLFQKKIEDIDKIRIGRYTAMLTHFISYLLPGLLIVLFKKDKINCTKINLQYISQIIIFSILIILPAVYIQQCNEYIIPKSWISKQTQIFEINMMNMSSFFDLIQNILLVGILAAIGEELIFRQIIQNQISKEIKSIFLSILISSIVFSTFHFQWEGFIPRILVSMLLGYIFNSFGLFYSILAHLIFNCFQVILLYLNIEIFELNFLFQLLIMIINCILLIHYGRKLFFRIK
jgi:membrane protease YdiL (CAAX protease family)